MISKKICLLIVVFFQLITFNIFAETVTFSTPQEISASPEANLLPRITSSSSGQYVYIIRRGNGPHLIIDLLCN